MGSNLNVQPLERLGIIGPKGWKNGRAVGLLQRIPRRFENLIYENR